MKAKKNSPPTRSQRVSRKSASRRREERATLALIAHDGKKAQMVGFVKDHLEILRHFDLIATSTTGQLVMEAGLKVRRVLSGPYGGDAQIASAVAIGACNGVIFLRDPLGMHPHDPDISSLMRICDVHDVPLATNLASARMIIHCLKR